MIYPLNRGAKMNRGMVAVAGLLAAMISSVASAAPAAMPVREFDIATMEKLGQQMYAQDELSKKAEAIVLAKYPKTNTDDWVVDMYPDKTVVRFLRGGPANPELLYDVTFTGDAPGVLSEPSERKLSAEDRAQYDASLLAFDAVPAACVPTYRAIVLKDPTSPDWLVWTLGTPEDPKMIELTGHYRSTVSSDGKLVRQTDTLEQENCIGMKESQIDFTRTLTRKGIRATPGTELDAFLSLSHNLAFVALTRDGLVWKIEHGRFATIEQDAPGIDGITARILAAQEETCNTLPARDGGKDDAFGIGTSTKVIGRSEFADKIAFDAPAGFHVAAVFCSRMTIVPTVNDYKVVLSGARLDIADTGYGRPRRIGELSLTDGKFEYKITSGPPLPAELQARVDKRLAIFQQVLARKR